MSIKVMTLVWDVKFPGLAPKMVALNLADCASDRGDSIFPGVKRIERTTGCVQSTVRKWLFAMEHSGLLNVVKRSVGGGHDDTTRRAFDMDLLRRLVSTEDKDGDEVPPELKIVEVRKKRLAGDENGAPAVVPLDDPRRGATVSVFEIVPNDDAPPGAGGAEPSYGQPDRGEGDEGGPEDGPDADPYGHSDQGVTPPPGGGVAGPTPPLNGGVDINIPPPDGGLPSAGRRSPLHQTETNRQEPSLPPLSPKGGSARERSI